MTDPCAVCAQNTEVKAKSGIFPCLGCKQMFCTQHVAFHRQELANELDLVIGDRNELQDALDRGQDICDVSAQMNIIDEWVKKTIEQVYQAADNVRQQVLHLVEEQKTSLNDHLTILSKQLDTFRENENFYEKDIENLKKKCIDLKHFLRPVDVNVIVIDVSPSLVQAVILKQKKEKAVKAPPSTETPASNETTPSNETPPSTENPSSTETSSVVENLSFVENIVKHQKPYKEIKIPHSGSVYMGKEIILLRTGDNFTLIDLKTNSLESHCLENSGHLVVCWSTCLNGLLCANPYANSKIKLIRMMRRDLTKTHESLRAVPKISCMICRGDRMILVCCGTEGNNQVEEWSLKDFGIKHKHSADPIHRWQPSLTCASNETVANISFDDERILLLITNASHPSKNRVEFRTRNMHVKGYLPLSAYKLNFSSLLYRLNDGWLLGVRKQFNGPWYFILIDNNLSGHEQKILSSHGIIDIQVVEHSSNKSLLAIYRQQGCIDTLTDDRSSLVLDLYEL